MKRFLILVFVFLNLFQASAQEVDTLKQPAEKKAHWLVGVDGYSALSVASLIGGMEHKRSRISISLSHTFGSSRFGGYYDFCVHREYLFFVGLGYHNSFRFKDFGMNKENYIDSLDRTHQEEKTTAIAFIPPRYETRMQYFFSFSISKEFSVYKGLHFNFKVMAVYGYNSYYKKGELAPHGGIQLYYKW